MTDNELLLAISDLFDKKLKPIKDDVREINLRLENDILSRLQKGIHQIEAMQADIEILKKVVSDHSEKLKKIS